MNEYLVLYSPNQRNDMHESNAQYKEGDIVAVGYPKVHTLFKLTVHAKKGQPEVRTWQSIGSRYHWEKRCDC